MIENMSGLEPLGQAVLVQHYEPEKKNSLIVMPHSVEERNAMVEQRAVVVAIGPNAWPGEAPRAAVGDKVYISRMAGFLTIGPADGKTYRVINGRDIFMKITKESENV